MYQISMHTTKNLSICGSIYNDLMPSAMISSERQLYFCVNLKSTGLESTGKEDPLMRPETASGIINRY